METLARHPEGDWWSDLAPPGRLKDLVFRTEIFFQKENEILRAFGTQNDMLITWTALRINEYYC